MAAEVGGAVIEFDEDTSEGVASRLWRACSRLSYADLDNIEQKYVEKTVLLTSVD